MANLPLITKYRPHEFDEVMGHESAIASLKRAIASDSQPHAYLFTGPAGIGKTTMARIVGKELEAEVTEIDAASNNGIDNIRELTEFGQHMSFTGTGKRLFIIDEVHRLSKPAFDALLKTLEDPPQHLYLALCTTERGKVPETIVTRCFETLLRPLSIQELGDLIDAVIDAEGWRVNNDVIGLVIQAATGQPRKALSILQQVHDAPSREEAARIVALVEPSDALIDLLKHLLSGKRSWEFTRNMLEKIEIDEEALIGAGRYISGALIRERHSEKAKRIWQMLDALVFPSETYDRKVSFIAAIGRIMWSD